MANFLSPEQIWDLKWRHKTSDRKKADKIKAILLLDRGYTTLEVAQILLLDDSTIRRWATIFETEGIESFGILSESTIPPKEWQTCFIGSIFHTVNPNTSRARLTKRPKFTTCLWLVEKGFNYTIQSKTGRDRVNINGAYNIEDHKVVIQESETINGQSTILLPEQMLKKHPRIRFLFLPPYSPNLNIIERLWHFFKKHVTYNAYYEKFAVFKMACINFFNNIENYRKELVTLMTDNFQMLNV